MPTLLIQLRENNWTTLGPEFGDDTRKWELFVHALYDLNSCEAGFCAHLGHRTQELGYEPCLYDPDL